MPKSLESRLEALEKQSPALIADAQSVERFYEHLTEVLRKIDPESIARLEREAASQGTDAPTSADAQRIAFTVAASGPVDVGCRAGISVRLEAVLLARQSTSSAPPEPPVAQLVPSIAGPRPKLPRPSGRTGRWYAQAWQSETADPIAPYRGRQDYSPEPVG